EHPVHFDLQTVFLETPCFVSRPRRNHRAGDGCNSRTDLTERRSLTSIGRHAHARNTGDKIQNETKPVLPHTHCLTRIFVAEAQIADLYLCVKLSCPRRLKPREQR